VDNEGPDSFDQIVRVDEPLLSTQAATSGILRVNFLLLFAYLVGDDLLLKGQFKSGVQLAAVRLHLVNSLLCGVGLSSEGEKSFTGKHVNDLSKVVEVVTVHKLIETTVKSIFCVVEEHGQLIRGVVRHIVNKSAKLV